MLFDLYKSNKRKNKTIGNKVNSLKTKPYSVFTELTSGKKKQLWFGLKPSWIDFIGFDMITMLKLIIPLKEHYYNSFIWLWKKSMLSSKNKNFQKKKMQKNLLHIEKPTKKYEYGINIYSIVFIIAHYYNVIK